MAKGRKIKIKTTKIVPQTNKELALQAVRPELMGSFGSVDVPLRVMPKYGVGLNSLFLKFPNLYGTFFPYQYGGATGGATGYISMTDAILLCQKAYSRVGMFKNSIDANLGFA